MEDILQIVSQLLNISLCTMKCVSVEFFIAYLGVYVFLSNFSYHLDYLPEIVIMITLKIILCSIKCIYCID